jgi:hypothetical protein
MDCAGTGAHRNESQTKTATSSDSTQRGKVLAFVPRIASELRMAA